MNQDLRNRVAEAAIVVAMLVGVWFAVAQPLQIRAEKAGARVRSLRAELDGYKASITLPPGEAQIYLNRAERLIALASPRAALAEHEQILDLARRAGLDVERINPTADVSPSRLGPIVTSSRRFQIETEGRFDEIAGFLSAISTRAPMTVVDHFTISMPDRSDPDRLVLSAGVRVGRISTQRLDVAEVRP